jgi:Protein of unknown function with PCYCGC motif
MNRKLPWLISAMACLVLVLLFLASRKGHAAPHPTPRPGITAEAVLPASSVASPGMPAPPQALEAYEAARRVPQVLDGLFCHCHCSETIGHRSLLTCFETAHGSQCDICMGEAMLAARMASSGSSLDEIRQAIDREFGS